MTDNLDKAKVWLTDTFDNETILIDEADTFQKAVAKVQERYGGGISSSGADQVDIVDKSGLVQKSFKVR